MKCPHCRVEVYLGDSQPIDLGQDISNSWRVDFKICPSCREAIITLICGHFSSTPRASNTNTFVFIHDQVIAAWPKTSLRPPCPPEVPKEITNDYNEACLVIADSPKASAALSRRCLQNLLRDAAGVTPGDLAKEIQQVLNSGKLPSHIAEAIDAIRNIGNFAAHPMKSKASGEIVDVEPEEAEWNLDVLEALFDFYYVQPAKTLAKKEQLNRKLQAAGKPPIK
jgi:hypothetical protein